MCATWGWAYSRHGGLCGTPSEAFKWRGRSLNGVRVKRNSVRADTHWKENGLENVTAAARVPRSCGGNVVHTNVRLVEIEIGYIACSAAQLHLNRIPAVRRPSAVRFATVASAVYRHIANAFRVHAHTHACANMSLRTGMNENDCCCPHVAAGAIRIADVHAFEICV